MLDLKQFVSDAKDLVVQFPFYTVSACILIGFIGFAFRALLAG